MKIQAWPLLALMVGTAWASDIVPHPKCDGDNCSQACTQENPHRVFHYEVQDQNNLQTCYANSAALMAQAVHPEYKPVSFVATALTSGARDQQSRSGAGSLVGMIADGQMASSGKLVFNRLASRGTCTAEQFPLEFGDLTNAFAHQRLLAGLARYFDTLTENKLEEFQARLSREEAARELAELAMQPRELPVSAWVGGECRFDGGTISADLVRQYRSLIDNMLSYQYRKKNSKDNFLAMIAPDCEANPYRPQFQAREKTGKKALENDRGAILNSLCRGFPVSFNTCNVMYSAVAMEQSGGNPDAEVANSSADCAAKGGAHVMTLVGSRQGAAGVEYLVQNSMGRRCYNPVNADGTYQNPANGIECEMDEFGPTGRFWVSRERFERLTYKYSIIQRP